MRELPILTNCGVSSFSSSALFKFRDRRFSVRIRGISSCRERAMLLSFTSWLDWMPNSTCDTNPASGLVRPSQSSEENFVNCALSLDRILLSCMGDASWWFGFLAKTLLPRISSPPTSQSRQATDLSMVRLSVFQIFGKLLVDLDLTTDAGGIHVTPGPPGTVRIHGILKAGANWFTLGNVESRIRELEAHPPLE